MELTDEDFFYIERNWSTVPLCMLAEKFGMNELELCILMREKNISKEVKPAEKIFIIESFNNGMSPKKIKEYLKFTSTQFSQICSRLGLKPMRGLDDMTEDEVIQNTKWLIKEEQLDINDFLPREIKPELFIKHNLSSCIRFANHHKKRDSFYKNFSAVAFLVCKSYPNTFKAFQFPHSKSNNYFKGVDGRKNYLNALIWVLEKKMKLDLKLLKFYVDDPYFLRGKDLSFYGLGYHTFKHLFDGTDDIRNEMIKMYASDKLPTSKSWTLKKKLEKANIPFCCSVNSCNYCSPDIHHIVPKSRKELLKKFNIDIDDVNNLIPLCPNHHKIAHKLELDNIIGASPHQWREKLIEQIKLTTIPVGK